jgi:hypothetical protein
MRTTPTALLSFVAAVLSAPAAPGGEIAPPAEPLQVPIHDTEPLRTFAGDRLPVPPKQGDPWEPPEAKVSKELLDATRVLFAQGLADPRGCAYREIRIAAGSAWGAAAAVATHGWVLPESKDAPGLFGIAWNGLVYPLLSAGEPADLEKDIAAAIARDEEEVRKEEEARKEQGSGRSFTRWIQAWGEGKSASATELLPAKVPLLLRLGKGELAGSAWKAWRVGELNREYSGDPYLSIARDWAWALFDRAIGGIMRGDDRLALADARALSGIAKAIDAEADRRGFKRPSATGTRGGKASHLTFLVDLPRITADLERRVREAAPPAGAAPKVGDAGKNREARIARLIRGLADARAYQWSQPGGVNILDAEAVKALLAEGKAAVEPLIECVEKDERLTRSVEFHRDFSYDRNVIPVRRAAYRALEKILETHSFGEGKESWQDIREMESDPDGARRVAARIREYWKKYGTASEAERWFGALADDAGSLTTWLEAAEGLAGLTADPGLRARKNPSVADLLRKRLRSARRGKGINANSPLVQAGKLAAFLASWDPDPQQVIEDLRRLAGRIAEAEDSETTLWPTMSSIAAKRAELGDEKALAEYDAWVGTLEFPKGPRPRDLGYVFHLLCAHPERPSATAAVEKLFGGSDPPWEEKVRDLAGSPLLVFPAFRGAVLAALADTSRQGTVKVTNGQFKGFNVKWDRGSTMGRMIDRNDLPPDGTERVVRACDECAWRLGAVPGLPDVQLYHATADIDKAIARAREILEKDGARIRWRPDMGAHPALEGGQPASGAREKQL